jgi:acetate---CoA ligase (ADP-forming)
LGLGGIFVEVLKDVATRVAPLRKEDARAMIDELKGRALLEGVRGSLPRDTEALVDILVRVSRLAIEMEDLIQEMDINPLIVQPRGEGAVAADALIVKAAQQ